MASTLKAASLLLVGNKTLSTLVEQYGSSALCVCILHVELWRSMHMYFCCVSTKCSHKSLFSVCTCIHIYRKTTFKNRSSMTEMLLLHIEWGRSRSLSYLFASFPRGKGPLKNTSDVIGAAKKIAEAGSRMDKLGRTIADNVSWKLNCIVKRKLNCALVIDTPIYEQSNIISI